MQGEGGYRLHELVQRFGGTVRGDPTIRVTRVASLDDAGTGDISFLSRARHREQLRSTAASAVILLEDDASLTDLPAIVCTNPYLYFSQVSGLFHPQLPPAPGIHPSAIIAPSALVAKSARINPHCHIGDQAVIGERVELQAGCVIGSGVTIGDDSSVKANVVIYSGSRIGQRAIIHAGAVIGSDGFGFANDDGQWRKIPQVGGVVIGDDVEIGAGTTIDRGALKDTVIDDGVKIDNQVQIGHNVRIGEHTALAGCVGVAGSAVIGARCTVGGGAIVLGHLSIADGVNISAGSLVSRSIGEPGTYTGVFPLMPNREWRQSAVLLKHLDALTARIKSLESEMVKMKVDR